MAIMRKIFFSALAVFLLAALAAALPGADIENTANGVSIWLPDDWETDNDEVQGAVYADAPEEDAFCVLQVLVNGDDLTAALSLYGDALSEEMDTFAATGKTQTPLNGMGAWRIQGEGRRDEKTWSVYVLLVSTGKAVLMCALGWEKDKEGQFAFLRDKIFTSIKKLE
jgi:hypothetical protein